MPAGLVSLLITLRLDHPCLSQAMSVGSVGWVLLDGRALVPPLRQMLLERKVRNQTEGGIFFGGSKKDNVMK